MKALQTLIKLQKSKLDELQRKLTALRKNLDQLTMYEDKIDSEVKEQTDFVKANPEFSYSFDAYKKLSLERKQNIERAKSDVQQQIDETTEEVQNFYSDMKKLEITQQSLATEKKAELEKKHRDEVEDITQMLYQRSGED